MNSNLGNSPQRRQFSPFDLFQLSCCWWCVVTMATWVIKFLKGGIQKVDKLLAKNQYTQKEIIVFCSAEWRVVKKQKNPIKVNLVCQKSSKSFCFFSKMMPNFWRLTTMCIEKIQQFHLSMLIFDQKSIYRTRAIITCSWFETTHDYKPRILDPDFLCLVHKMSVI